MPWTPSYIPLTLKEKLVFIARKLVEAMSDQRKFQGIALPLVCLLDARLRYLMNQLLAAIAATPSPRPQPRATTRPAQKPTPTDPPRERRLPIWLRSWSTVALGRPPPLSRRFGVLRRTFAHYAINGYIAQIEHLLTTEDMIAAIARNPAVPRILRPLCHLCGIKPPASIALPKRPRKPRPKPSPKPGPKPEPSRYEMGDRSATDDRSIVYFIPKPENPRNFIPVYPPGSPLRYDTHRSSKKSR